MIDLRKLTPVTNVKSLGVYPFSEPADASGLDNSIRQSRARSRDWTHLEGVLLRQSS
jgi:hypothetical protein